VTAAAAACTRCQTALEDGDLRCAVCALPVPPPESPRGDARPRALILRCSECGAAVAFSGAAQGLRCGFCGATMAIEQPLDPVEEARWRVRFAVDRQAAEAAVRRWLGSRGWFAPRALAGEAVLESLTPLSWAAWLVNAQAHVAWAADSDAGAQRSAWAPHTGEASLVFRDIVVPASRGLRDVEARLLIPHYDLGPMVAVDRVPAASDPGLAGRGEPERVNGATHGVVPGGSPEPMPMPEPMPEPMIERFDTQRSAARRHVQARIEALAKVRIEPRIPGRRYRNVHVACLLERQTTERIALPAWVLAYRYRGNPYRAIVHGQRAEVVFGRAPIDWSKVGWLIAIVGAIVAIAVALALIFTR
jgi:hypothetical protein